MVVPPSSGGTSSTSTMTQPTPANGTLQVNLPKNATSNTAYPTYAAHIPFSARRAPPLDMASVERRGHPMAVRETHKRIRPHGLQDAPTFRPTADEFRDPMEYIRKIAPEGRKYGICKIIPPEGWTPGFAIDTEAANNTQETECMLMAPQKFHFRTRRQELNSVEGGTRTNLNYLDQLSKFHKQHGINLNRLPSVDKKPLNLFKLKQAVETRGGFEKVCKLKKWAEIGRDLGYSGKIMSSLSTSLKNSYQKWLHPYEEYLRVAKPGVQQQLEFEYGGPFTPPAAHSPMKRSYSQQASPMGPPESSAAIQASAALHTSVHQLEERPEERPHNAPYEEPQQPMISSGFTAVNTGGFTPVNLTPASFQAVNASSPLPKRDKSDSVSAIAPRPIAECLASAKGAEGQSLVPNGVPLVNGQSPKPLKRAFSHDNPNAGGSSKDAENTTDGVDENGRRSKRLKKAPTVVGSHMSMLRPSVPRPPVPRYNVHGKTGEMCDTCGKTDDKLAIFVCDGCENSYHWYCLDPAVEIPANQDWHCPRCLVGTGEFGFEEGGIYSLKQFQEKAQLFKDSYFAPKMPYDPVLNTKRQVTEDDVEREFWRLVESITETVEVEYGADIHSTTHGSGFPTIEKSPLDTYSTDPWNLNILPLHPESLFRHIKSDISGMTVPWLYVGMCFSTFCWHNEDHYSYSANYQHFGSTKTWYGIPGADAERFEEAMRQAVPDLFETQPDLLFQLVTLLPPGQLKKAGVNVYALDQRAGQFVITFPQAYHAGFNHGFNFNEAVNFAPHDWEPFGEAGVERLQAFRKQPCFSHDELLMTAAARDTTIKTAKWLAPALQRLRQREMQQRADLLKRHKEYVDHHCSIDEPDVESNFQCELGFEVDERDVPENDYQCTYCKAYSYLSRFRCNTTSKVMCLLHAGSYDCCDAAEELRLTSVSHSLIHRYSDSALEIAVQKVTDRSRMPEAWQEKLDKILEDEPKPPLKVLRSLVGEGERIPYELPGLPDLKAFVNKCNAWVDEATNFITRKQQNRRKNDRVWRKNTSAKATEQEERDKELRKIENIHKLLAAAEEISFDCPEITTLTERSENIADFQRDARAALKNPGLQSTQEFEELVERGKGFNVEIPEIERLDQVVQQMKWTDKARELRGQFQTLEDVAELITRAGEIAIPEHSDLLLYYKEQQSQGELWEAKAKELISVESVHYQQLEALSTQAGSLPVSKQTLAAVDAILAKQREAHRQIQDMYDKSRNADFRTRPKYKAVRDVLDGLSELNSKPTGTIDLEKEIKRHEDWMRKGKKLFGKANAPLHILQMHMNYVAEHNRFCFDLQDKPRLPVEPSSREHTPVDSQEVDSQREREVFCMCRQPEAGLMIECEVCHEWYHGKCLKIARGKFKEDDKYTCPICDWRVKIPRDAARPKLEELQEWQQEITSLPFQPEEEDTLQEIIQNGAKFKDFMKPYTNPMISTSQEVATQRFYLRKIEGAEILLSDETNFFRRELHKWAPVAPIPPPMLDVSLSTRKPRPTKQQKEMSRLGITNPDDLPQHLRTKQHSFPKQRKSSDANSNKGHHPLQPAPRRGRGRSGTPNSASMGSSRDAHTHSHRLPAAMTSASTDSSYPAYFPSPQSNSHHTGSPAFASGPYYHHPQSLSSHSSHLDSPGFPPRSPMSRSAPALDPSLFSPTNNHFASTIGGRQSQGHHHMLSPQHNPYSISQSARDMDHVFAEFTTDPIEDPGPRNEAAEALEDRRRDEEEEHSNRLVDEFLH
ncbi:MAG: hypothetical protein LQ345_001635 [Seirophora villosa]|nr:MAG: hypothetical protein LQ345_001635 [Seirophora villosa]